MITGRTALNNKKQISINLLANSLTFIISFAISFFYHAIYINNVGSEAYGFVGLANSFINYAALLSFALNSMAGMIA